MPDIASFLILQAVVPANGAQTAQYIVPRGDSWKLMGCCQFATSQSCFITDIRDSRGFHYSNASPSVPLPLNTFQQLGSAQIGINVLPFPIVLDGDTVLQIDFKDTSGAQNTVGLILVGQRSTGGT